MNRYLQKLIFIIFTFSLYGCGPDSSDSEPVADSPSEPVIDAFGKEYSGETITVSGKAIDGYLQNASVCIDVNDNGRCDSTDPQATTDSEGSYSIDVPAAIADIQPNLLVYALANSTTDSDDLNQPIEKGYAMSAPWGSQNITPFTSMVVETMKTGTSKAAAEEQVKQQLKIDFVDKDYIAMKSASSDEAQKAEDAHKKAKMLVHVIASIRQQFDTSDGQPVEKQQADSAYNFYMEDGSHMTTLLDKLKSKLDDSSDSIDYEQVQKSLTEDALALFKTKKGRANIAQGYGEVVSAEEKTRLLKEYISKGYWYDNEIYSSSLQDNQWKLTELKYSNGVWEEDNQSYLGGYDDLVYVESENRFKKMAFGLTAIGVTFDNKGNVVISDGLPSASRVKNKLDLAGRPLMWVLTEATTETFPSGAEAISLQLILTKDVYEIALKKDYQLLQTLDDLMNQYKHTDDTADSSIKIARDLYGQFGTSESQSANTGSVHLYKHQTKLDKTGSWHRETLPGSNTEIIRIQVPDDYTYQDKGYAAPFFVVRPHPDNSNSNVVWSGSIEKAGSKGYMMLYNKVAIDAIKQSIAK